jgi:hypothetical protein
MSKIARNKEIFELFNSYHEPLAHPCIMNMADGENGGAGKKGLTSLDLLTSHF